ncbi:hypothetical protein BDA99DRAFT_525808 [Phascolomyces articulosus]|uniref:Uncharacterized protein n=1 Tax=Phascolomyces articulosus TaxID=60185 RepID=A0AAD5P8E3_9FUNG|nr:hypothetical protein BDA99DRAFT_525808 [Phascolomyces articulosus]
MPILSLGYLTTPVSIEASIHANNQYELSPTTVLSIVGFGPTTTTTTTATSDSLPNTMLPTIAKFILTMPSTSTLSMAEKELMALLHESLHIHNSYAIIPLHPRHVGILLPLLVQQQKQQEPHYQFTFQISQMPSSSSSIEKKNESMIPSFDLEQLKHLPIQAMELCQNRQEEQLRMVARKIYTMATIYGYWDLWLVFEGICTRFQINPQQLVQSSS